MDTKTGCERKFIHNVKITGHFSISFWSIRKNNEGINEWINEYIFHYAILLRNALAFIYVKYSYVINPY